MPGGPQNFMTRLIKELNFFDLPPFEIINPSINQNELYSKNDKIILGRLDGLYYYLLTSTNFYNLILQRKNIKVPVIKHIPDCLSQLVTIPFNRYLNRMNVELINHANAIIYQSDLSKKMHERIIGKTQKPSIIIRNGIPTDIFKPLTLKNQLSGNPKLIITASFRLHKRLQEAIKLTQNLKKKYPKIKLHVVGDMDILTKKCIQELDTDDCVFHGRIPSEELPKLYSNADLGLSLCIFDACPNSVIEMMGCGLPVLTLEESGAAELIKEKSLIIKEGLIFDYMPLQDANHIPSIDIDKWSQRVEYALDNKDILKEKMLSRIKEELDIRLVASKYAEFIQSNA